MSRAAFYDALVSDATLNDYGINVDTVFHSWSNEERPSDTTAFVILNWGVEEQPIFQGEPERGPRALTMWVHFPLALSNDFNKVTRVLDRVDELVTQLRDVPGEDGYTLSFVVPRARSGDLTDDGFQTITRNGNYDVYSVKS